MTPLSSLDHAVGRHVLLIGPASFGPYVEPMLVESPEDARSHFGGALGEALARAFPAGARLFGIRIRTGSREATYYALEEAYESLVRQPVDWVVPLITDDGEPIAVSPVGFPEGYAGQLARFSLTSVSLLAPKLGLIQTLDRQSPLPLPPPEATGFPLGRLVAATPMRAISGDERYDLAPTIAAALAAAPRDRGLSGVQIPGVSLAEPLYPSEADLVRRARAGLIVLQETVRKGWAVHRAVTQDPGGVGLSGMRAAMDCLWRIRYRLSPFIGGPQNSRALVDEHEAVRQVLSEHPWVVDAAFEIQRTGRHDQALRLEMGFRNEVNRLGLYSKLPRA